MGEVLIREGLEPGDIGYILYLHGKLYHEEYGFNEEFETYVAGLLTEYMMKKGPRDRFWIVEDNGEIRGCVAIVEHLNLVAQMRFLLLHPDLRGKGIGKELVARAIEFAGKMGYSSIFLTTQDILEEAAGVYHHFGFELTEEKTNEIWGIKARFQRYDLVL
jgi:N-acetylglutamate synthase-like GNAT family acetyltransferase